MFLPNINKDDLKQLPALQFQGTIHVIDSVQWAEDVCNVLINEKMLGFDTETKPSFKRGKSNKVAILQLATHSDAYLFKVKKIGIPDKLAAVLSSPLVLKIGAAIHDDIRHLKQISFFKEAGFLDLQSYVKQFGIESCGLSKLSGIVLNHRISKSQQLSNWENDLLTEGQLVYAATDAWASLEIYNTLNNHTNA
jgi:ribonuclease D